MVLNNLRLRLFQNPLRLLTWPGRSTHRRVEDELSSPAPEMRFFDANLGVGVTRLVHVSPDSPVPFRFFPFSYLYIIVLSFFFIVNLVVTLTMSILKGITCN